ncbi:ferritin-like domain-containing protein, partial [Nocardioides sp.]|uniref:ferritin-like domain-containing protein n=1 Tax=Nocardioides sp. TaxID=35761 RepID=UPI002733E18C
AGEHAAVWVLGVLGARASGLSDPATPGDRLREELAASYREHRARRDHLDGVLRDLGESPVASAPTYDEPDGIAAPAGLRAAALGVEQASATAYAHLVAHSTGPLRAWAVAALSDAATRGLVFRGTPENFPGIDELAGR